MKLLFLLCPFKIITLRTLQLNKFPLNAVLFHGFLGSNYFVLMMFKAFVSLVPRIFLVLLGLCGPGCWVFQVNYSADGGQQMGGHGVARGKKTASLNVCTDTRPACDFGHAYA